MLITMRFPGKSYLITLLIFLPVSLQRGPLIRKEMRAIIIIIVRELLDAAGNNAYVSAVGIGHLPSPTYEAIYSLSLYNHVIKTFDKRPELYLEFSRPND